MASSIGEFELVEALHVMTLSDADVSDGISKKDIAKEADECVILGSTPAPDVSSNIPRILWLQRSNQQKKLKMRLR